MSSTPADLPSSAESLGSATVSSMDLPLVWIDLEMTGLDPEVDVIVEIAAIITDGSLEEIIEGPGLVLHADETALREHGADRPGDAQRVRTD